MRCSVFGCTSDNQKKNRSEGEKLIRFYTFPKNEKLSEVWKVKCRRGDSFNAATARICSRHFAPDSFIRNLQHELLGINNRNSAKLKEGATPTLNLPSTSCQTVRTEDTCRKERAAARLRKTEIEKILEKTTNEEKIETNIAIAAPEKLCTGCISFEYRIAELKEEIIDLKRQLDIYSKNLDTEKAIKQRLALELQKSSFSCTNIEGQLRTIFTDGQIRKLVTPKKGINWSEDDIAKAIKMYSTGARSYKLLLKKGFPYPSIRTLQRWSRKVDIGPMDKNLIESDEIKIEYVRTETD